MCGVGMYRCGVQVPGQIPGSRYSWNWSCRWLWLTVVGAGSWTWAIWKSSTCWALSPALVKSFRLEILLWLVIWPHSFDFSIILVFNSLFVCLHLFTLWESTHVPQHTCGSESSWLPSSTILGGQTWWEVPFTYWPTLPALLCFV